MVKITSLLTAALFGAVAMAMPVAKPDVVVVTVYETAVAVPSPVNNVVIKTVYETVYARPADKAEPSASLIPHKPQPAPVVSAAPAPAPVLSVPPVVAPPVAPTKTTAAPTPTRAPVAPAPAPVPTRAPVAPAPAPVQPPSSGNWQSEMLSQVNAVRARAGKAALTLSSQLNSVAQAHSQYMSSTRDMTHSNPGGSLGTRVGAAGIKWNGAAENIAWNQKTVSQVMDAWTKSPGHYANMVGDYTSVGFGEANLYWTQDFVKN
ncbi:hypothetical protein H4S04_003382 [Coemansia sp. S16]|nr:hypothetical protein H4S03_000154 [Coemansia sp. S3946]KAJ2049191.1 hypothetical protein H4S04_003382 [Coemansia sp. S16]KAJ2432172.1 hypothetical protein GGF41_000143 [Coemansia sp. RSA 2531]